MKLALIASFAALLALAHAQAKCQTGCTVDADCEPDQDCNMCMKGVCASGCSGNCVGDKDCGDPNCPYCAGGICSNSPAHTCGQSCGVNSDCNGESNCQICFNSQCTAGCGGICGSASDCVGECQHCIFGVCAADNVTCNGACQTSLDCIQTSQCNTCINGACGAACGQPCSQDNECVDGGCKYCQLPVNGTVGVCGEFPVNKKCGEHCTVNAQCTGSPGTCGACIKGKCGSACADPCKQDTDCVVFHCQKCNGGKCSAS